METLEFLLKDAPFLAASALFLISLSVFLWGLSKLKSISNPSFTVRPPAPAERPPFPATTEKKGPANAPPPAPDMGATIKLPAPIAEPPRKDADLVISMMEDKFIELAKRVAAMEHPKKEQAPSYLEPLLKRVQDMEAELKTLKFAFTQLASAQNAINVGDITAKIQGIQKLLENLTGGTEVSKPS